MEPFKLGLGDSTIVIHCRDSWSTIVMMIIFFYYRDSIRHDIWMNFYGLWGVLHATNVCLIEHCIPDHLLTH